MNQAAEADERWMLRAIELSRLCPPNPARFNVGAVIISADGDEMSFGYSRETDEHIHAEESALAKLPAYDARLCTATIYTSMEPCSERQSLRDTCTRLILAARVPRVSVAWREPAALVTDCIGVELLQADGVEVVELPQYASAVRKLNAHLLAALQDGPSSVRAFRAP
jgi:diaminohydroxyphosphoribosylaminopyrimidine deaminase / 5-amino-6-(5-phosphoribosylamino)uracil reductase